jgi:predicted ATPase/class 3 adenylate cyclase
MTALPHTWRPQKVVSMRLLPGGTVTLVFTDIEGSTRLLETHGPDYVALLADHRRAIRDAFQARDGIEVDTAGDSFFFVFESAAGAAAAALDAQTALARGPIRVRMGLHTGEPVVTPDGYVGIDVHRAARIMAAANGGQVLVSQATRDLLEDGALLDLGEHRLKDLTAPTRLWQLGAARFGPLATLHQTNLPIQATPLVGRAHELAEARALLATSRLLTLTGPGGSGKTRLALQLAAESVEDHRGGVWWVPLAAEREPSRVLARIGDVVGGGDRPAEAIGSREMLLLLDNMEHMLESAGDVGALMRSCEGLRIIVTSRAPLRIRGEQRLEVTALSPADAATLFVERAHEASPSTILAPSVIAEIVTLLDGLPLAIELAAARTDTLAPTDLRSKLSDQLSILVAGPRDAPERQRSLRHTIEWSYELLPTDAKAAFRKLSVMASGFDLAAALDVSSADIDCIATLIEHSLARRIEDRYEVLETIRQYAAELAGSHQEREAAERRHVAHYVAVATATSRASSRNEWLTMCRLERDNFRLALDRAAADGDDDAVIRLFRATGMYWLMVGAIEEGERWGTSAMQAADRIGGRIRYQVRMTLSEFPRFSGEPERAIRLKEDALRLARLDRDVDGESEALDDIALTWAEIGRFDRAHALLSQARSDLEASSPDPWTTSHHLATRAEVALLEGNAAEALELVLRLDEVERTLDLGFIGVVESRCLRAKVDHANGRTAQAEAGFRDAVHDSGEIDLKYPLVDSLDGLVSICAVDRQQEAVRLLGMADRMRAEARVRVWDGDRHARVVASLRDSMDPRSFDEIHAAGRALGLPAIIASVAGDD